MEETPRVFLLPGEYFISKKPHIVSTLLGSCISVCLYHKTLKFGGMNHYMLPHSLSGVRSAKYGNYAINLLIRFMKMGAGSLNGVCALIYGGGNVVGALRKNTLIGEQNIKLAKEILAAHNIPIIKEVVGGNNGYKLTYQTWDNKMTYKSIGQQAMSNSLVLQDDARLNINSSLIAEANINNVKIEKFSFAKSQPTVAVLNKGLAAKIKVLVVDDSALSRNILTKALNSAPDIIVVGEAEDPFEARKLILEEGPDVIILDIIMPKMNGVTFLKKLMIYYPIPVIICSTIAQKGSATRIRADKIGAFAVVDKGTLNLYEGLDKVQDVLLPKVRAAARAKVFKKSKEEIAGI